MRKAFADGVRIRKVVTAVECAFVLQYRGRRAAFNQTAVFQAENLIIPIHLCLGDLVRNVEQENPRQRSQQPVNLSGCLRIQMRRDLIADQDLGFAQDGPGQAQAGGFTAGTSVPVQQNFVQAIWQLRQKVGQTALTKRFDNLCI